VNGIERGLLFGAFAHQDHTLNDIRLVDDATVFHVIGPSHVAQPDLGALCHLRNVFYPKCGPALSLQNGLLDIMHIAKEPEGANVHLLHPNLNEAAAGVDVVIGQLAYVAALNANGGSQPDALVVVDVDRESDKYGQIVGRVDMPNVGDELHHFGWNACSSALCPYAPHPHVERRYLIVPGLRSSRIHVIDTKDNPKQPRIVKVIEPKDVEERTGYSRPHTVHCGPDGIYLSALGSPSGDGPGGIFALDHYNFEPLGRWEVDRGPQYFGYDFAWHLAMTSRSPASGARRTWSKTG
jgi:hypothetical protein